MAEKGSRATTSSRREASRSRHSVTLSETILEIATSEPIQFIDLTDRINQHLAANAVENGTVTVFSRHTTAAIKINEAEELLPTLLEAGYAATDDEAGTWWFTAEGVARAEQLEPESDSLQ